MLGQRRRRWANIKTTLDQRIVFDWHTLSHSWCDKFSHVWNLANSSKLFSSLNIHIYGAVSKNTCLVKLAFKSDVENSLSGFYYFAPALTSCSSICHFAKWQIHPFVSKGAMCLQNNVMICSMRTQLRMYLKYNFPVNVLQLRISIYVWTVEHLPSYRIRSISQWGPIFKRGNTQWATLLLLSFVIAYYQTDAKFADI